MCIAIIIPDSWEPGELVRWSSTLARSKHEHLLIIRARRLAKPQKKRKTLPDVADDDSPLMAAIREHASDFLPADHHDPRYGRGQRPQPGRAEGLPPSTFLVELDRCELVPGVMHAVKELRVGLLIVPRRQGVRISEDDFLVERQLFSQVPCEILQLRPGKNFTDERDPILVATDGKQQASPVLNLGAALGKADESQVTAVFVRKNAEPPPRKKRSHTLEQWMRRLPSIDVVSRPAIDRLPPSAPPHAVNGHDMLFVGPGDPLADDQQIRACVPQRLMNEVEQSTIVVVRGRLPLAGRLIRTIEDRKKSIVPQLDRRGRIEVVERLESVSNWDFDFLILIFLATLLAALGLVVDSAPVVIGAMLVAPLMAPMLGIGMSVVQGNRIMADRCLVTVGRGFLLAFATGCAVGIFRMVFASGLTDEMLKRGAPNVIDLVVAFVSGVVAAYAFGRPHLLSVLPGIAIASSLVPPIAASGLSLIAFNFEVAVGAVLLFLSNFVAIVLGSAFALWIVGMRGPREVNPFTEWAQRWMLGFFAVAVCLAVFFSFKGSGSQLRAALIAMDPTPAAEAPADTPSDTPPPTASSDPAASSSATPSTPPTSDDSQHRVAHKPVAANPAPASQQPAAAVDDPPTPPQAGVPSAQATAPPATAATTQTPAPEAPAGEAAPGQSPSVTVVIPKETQAEGANTSVQIEGLPTEHVAEILGEVLGDGQKTRGEQPVMLLIVAVGLFAVVYVGWRHHRRT